MDKPMTLPRITKDLTLGDGEKYTLEEEYTGITALRGYSISSPASELHENGVLILKPGFRWDGPSGPARDILGAMMPSALHDELYNLLRLGELPVEARAPADYTYRDALKTWGVSKVVRMAHLRGVRIFGFLFSR